jgi:hypothetical protein
MGIPSHGKRAWDGGAGHASNLWPAISGRLKKRCPLVLICARLSLLETAYEMTTRVTHHRRPGRADILLGFRLPRCP